MNKESLKSMLRFVYWILIPLVAYFIVLYQIVKIDINIGFIEYMIIGFKYIFVVLIFLTIHSLIGGRLFKEKMTLAKKIMTCKLRRENGNSYCADCPDGYKCATDLK